MYLWCLLPSLTSAGPVAKGTSADLASAMRLTGPAVGSGVVFMVAIKELTRRISVADLVPGYVPTGREWRARRDVNDQASWSTHLVPVDPREVYYLPVDPVVGAEPAGEQVDAPVPRLDAPR